MPIAIITGSGTHVLPGLEGVQPVQCQTPFGSVPVSRGEFAGVDVLHISRHGAGHIRLSNHITHRANIWALHDLGATAVIGCTACGALDATLALGSIVVFDDLHFSSNRLSDGSLCTFFMQPGDRERGHWILQGGPFSAEVRAALLGAAADCGYAARDGGAYGHVDGPRFNTPTEIAQLAACGVVAVSQTAGPETVLCGELELPFALMGFVTDYANDVVRGANTPVAKLIELMGSSSAVFADVLRGAVRTLAEVPPVPAGTVYRFQRG
jgi:purine nucleoside phosphorylase